MFGKWHVYPVLEGILKHCATHTCANITTQPPTDVLTHCVTSKVWSSLTQSLPNTNTPMPQHVQWVRSNAFTAVSPSLRLKWCAVVVLRRGETRRGRAVCEHPVTGSQSHRASAPLLWCTVAETDRRGTEERTSRYSPSLTAITVSEVSFSSAWFLFSLLWILPNPDLNVIGVYCRIVMFWILSHN